MSPPAPKAFISYAWSSPSHQAWVVQLATRLRQDGVDAILDKWHLQPGHDSLVFMEQMVTDADVRKVLLICNKEYAEKANSRVGGVGTESQIISPEVYAKAVQNKFVAVITELSDDGQPYLPVFFKGRIYIDLSEEERFEAQYEELLRWALDRPSLLPPPVGIVPAHIVSEKLRQPISTSAFLRAQRALEDGLTSAGGTLKGFADLVPEALDAFRMPPASKEVERDDQIVLAIEGARPLVRQVGLLATSIARYDISGRYSEIILDILELFAQRMYRPESVNSWNDWDFDNFKFSANEVFLVVIAAYARENRFDLIKDAFDRVYLVRGDGDAGRRANSFGVFSQHLKSLDGRKARLKLNRISLHADLLKKAYENHKPGFVELLQADFLAFLRGWLGIALEAWPEWWPNTLVFATHRYHAFDLFIRAESASFAEKIAPVFQAQGAEELTVKLLEMSKRPNLPRFDYHAVDISMLSNAQNLGKRP